MMKLSSPAFAHNTDMPATYTCQGENHSPPLRIADVPPTAKSLVLIVDDPDAPDPAAPTMVWDHWILIDVPADTAGIPENGTAGISCMNSWKRTGYGGPCPPIGTHRYFFRLYALDTTLDLPSTADKAAVEAAMDGHIVERTELIGLYRKS